MARRRAPKRVNQSKRRRSAASARRRREESAGIDRRGSYLASRNRPHIRYNKVLVVLTDELLQH
jgi:hypothetical protein